MTGVKRPATEADKGKPYYKYYEKEMYYGPQASFEKAERGPLDEALILQPQNLNDLLQPIANQEAEIGYKDFGDGTAYVASLKMLPGVSAEMLDWWFAWHGLEPFRYTIWNPEDHCGLAITEETRRILLDEILSHKEKLWRATHVVSEDVGGGVADIRLGFDKPWEIGFDRAAVDAFPGTIVCSADRKEEALKNWMGLIMCHVGRQLPEGLELRTRFWIGYAIDEDKKPLKVTAPDAKASAIDPKKLLLHDIREFSNLGSFLPSLYAEEKDNW